MDHEQQFWGHLAELRQRLLLAVVVWAVCSGLAFVQAGRILEILLIPAAGLVSQLAFFSPPEAFSAYLRIAFFCGLILSSPVLVFQAWMFIMPALDVNERFRGFWFIAATLGAFASGILFGYAVLLPSALRFLMGLGGGHLQPVIGVSEYAAFVTSLVLACGILFEMPVLIFLLARFGIVSASWLRRHYGAAVIVLLILAAVVTPTQDPFNMFLLAGPMLLLFEVSVWLAAWAGKPASGW